MFSEAPSATLIEVNYAAALAFVMEKLSLAKKESKQVHSVLQSAACARAGCEVQQGLGHSNSGEMSGIRCHTDTKWSNHHAAFLRHVKLLFRDTLSPYRSRLPSWLNDQFVTQRTLRGALFDPTKPGLWKTFEKASRVVKCVYLPKYNMLVPATEKLPSGEAWLEALERFRKALWLHEKQSPSNENEADDNNDDNTETTQTAEDAVAAEDAEDAAAAEAVDVNDLDTLNALIVPEAYVPKYLLAFILLGPFSLEPNPAWNITSLAVGKSKKVLPSSVPVERPSSTPDAVVLSPTTFVTPDGNIKPLSRADISEIRKEMTGKKKRERDGSSAHEVAALERSNTIMEAKNVILADKNKARAKRDAIELKKEGIRMAIDLQMDEAVIRKLKMEVFEMIQNTN